MTFVVIGAGLAGAATAWQLARRGHPVTLLERTFPANPGGSSHGSARIFRYAYPDPLYASLVLQAKADWDDVQAQAGRSLITPADAVDYGELRDPNALAALLAGIGVPHQLLTAAAARERWPGIAFDTDVLWHRGGVIDAVSAVNAMVDLARADGAVVLTDWPVASIARHRSAYLVTSAAGEQLPADNVVVAAGAWLPDLLGSLSAADSGWHAMPPLTVQQEQIFHFPYQQGQASGWPTFIHKGRQIQTYGLPGLRDAGFRGQKVAEFNAGPVIGSAAHADRMVDPANRARVTDYVRRYLPGLIPEPYAEATCLFTSTPSEDFVLHRRQRLTILSACSGHGAKFAPLLGRVAADVATGLPGPDRFALIRAI